jgi:hypothetical protein
MKSKIQVTEVKEVRGFIHPMSVYAGDPNRYNSSRFLSRSYIPKALFVSGIIDGNSVSFYSPTVVVTHTDGFLVYDSIDENNWFELIEKGQKSYHGSAQFDGGNTPNVAVVTKSEIVPRIKRGDIITISYTMKGGKIKGVRIIN